MRPLIPPQPIFYQWLFTLRRSDRRHANRPTVIQNRHYLQLRSLIIGYIRDRVDSMLSVSGGDECYDRRVGESHSLRSLTRILPREYAGPRASSAKPNITRYLFTFYSALKVSHKTSVINLYVVSG